MSDWLNLISCLIQKQITFKIYNIHTCTEFTVAIQQLLYILLYFILDKARENGDFKVEYHFRYLYSFYMYI